MSYSILAPPPQPENSGDAYAARAPHGTRLCLQTDEDAAGAARCSQFKASRWLAAKAVMESRGGAVTRLGCAVARGLKGLCHLPKNEI